MTALELWIEHATKCLSRESAAQVRAEITEHYQSARESAISNGVAVDDADRRAIEALGNAQSANKQYREVMLTEAEAKMLRRGNREASFVCSHSWLKWTMLAFPLAGLLVAAALWNKGENGIATTVFVGAMFLSNSLLVPFLPIYTPSRSQIFRAVKWIVQAGALVWLFADDLKSSWLIACCMWPIFQIEWTRITIRRKLPVAQWPKQLYL